jgi:hypothetical protein
VREQREAYVRANRKDVDRYAGVTDPVELLRLMHTAPEPDPLVNLLPPPETFEELYLSLTLGQAARLMTVASELLPVEAYQADDIAKCLAAFTGFTLDPLLQEWMDHDRPYPALIFRGAGPSVRDWLLQPLPDDATSLRADHVLSALAWIGDEAVIQYLQGADAERHAWADRLYIPPTSYARVAGWEIVAGERRELTFKTCVGLHVANDGESRSEHVRVMQQRLDACPWCGGRLVNLLEVDFGEPPLDALSCLRSYLEIVTCPFCTMIAPIHGRINPEGRGYWVAANVRPDTLPKISQNWDPSPWSKAAVRLLPRRPTHAADWSLPTTLSQIGGLPGWVQDIAYPACLRCAKTMTFLAQIDEAAFPYREGVYYAFVCPLCRTTTTTYQQT